MGSKHRGISRSNPATRVVLEKLRTSLWLVPGLMAIGAFALAAAANWADFLLSEADPAKMPIFLFTSPPNDAREVLATLLSSMVTMTSLVFSITMVVLSLAANQFGPRLIRSFMANSITQCVLGTFIMTSVYCLLELGAVGSTTDDRMHAFPSVSLAILLTLVSLIVLVIYLHFLARSIVSETIIKRLGMEIDDMLGELGDLPEELYAGADYTLLADLEHGAVFVGPQVDGFVQSIDMDALKKLGDDADVTIILSFRPGDYVIADGGGIAIQPGRHSTVDLPGRIDKAIVTGSRRTSTQDPEFVIRHLVEMAVRALSPGVNDPYTAVAVLAQLSAGLAHLMGRALPQGAITGRDGKVRVVVPQPTYASIVGAAFNQIRQNANGKPFVILHLIDAIHRITGHARNDEQLDILNEQLDAAEDAVGMIGSYDRNALEARANAAREAIEQARARLADQASRNERRP
ncbi:MAG: DUF2254 domain-containing protein [Pseudorhizobium sp.]